MGKLTSEQIAKLLGAEPPIKLKAKTVQGRITEGLGLWVSRRKASAKSE